VNPEVAIFEHAALERTAAMLSRSVAGGRRHGTFHHMMWAVSAGNDEPESVIQLLRQIDLQDLKFYTLALSVRFCNDFTDEARDISADLMKRQNIDLADPEAVPLGPYAQDSNVLTV
jgi:hypothetical protein